MKKSPWWENATPIFVSDREGLEFYEIYSKSDNHYVIVHWLDDGLVSHVITLKNSRAVISLEDQP